MLTVQIFYCIKKGKNGTTAFTAMDGITSASKIAPVDIMLQIRPVSSEGPLDPSE